MKEIEKLQEHEIMRAEIKKATPPMTYTYIRDIVFAAMITGLILKSVNNAENVATITQQITQHEHWGQSEQKELNERLLRIEERLREVEINTNNK